MEKIGKRRLALWGGYILFLLLASFVLIFAIQSASSPQGFEFGWEFVTGATKAYLWSVFVWFLMMAGVSALVRRPVLVVMIFAVLVRIFSSISLQKYTVRGMWLLPEDLQLASQVGELAGMVNVWGIVRMVLMVAVIIAVGIFANKVFERWRKEWTRDEPKLTTSTSWLMSVGVFVTSVVLFFASTLWLFFPAEPKGGDTWLGTAIVKWNQVENYKWNGLFFGFLFNMKPVRAEKPEGWTREAVEEITARYQQRSIEENTGRMSLADEDINILFVMNESFYDPTDIKEFYPWSGGDITPNLHNLQQYALSRTHFSPEYGGGTANIEFEALTGLTNFWFGGMPFQDTVSRRPGFPSIAGPMNSLGYRTIGVHPYNGEFYKRVTSYKHMGFDEFYDQEDFVDPIRLGRSPYIADESAYDFVLDLLEADDQKKFISLITMQNHTPYDQVFDEHELQFKLEREAENKGHIEGFFQMLHYSDAALGGLIERLSASDKKVVLVFWGDHSPGLWHDLIYTENDDLIHKTPLVIWKNFEENGTMEEIPGMVSANQIGNIMFDALGAQKPYLYYLLDDLMKVTPVLARPYMSEEWMPDSPVIRDYEFVNYHMFANKQD